MNEASNKDRYRDVVAALSLASLPSSLGLRRPPVLNAASPMRFLKRMMLSRRLNWRISLSRYVCSYALNQSARSPTSPRQTDGMPPDNTSSPVTAGRCMAFGGLPDSRSLSTYEGNAISPARSLRVNGCIVQYIARPSRLSAMLLNIAKHTEPD